MTGRRLFWVLLATLIAAGCLRPVLPALLRDRWALTVVVLAAALFALELLRSRRLEGETRHEAVLRALLPLALAALYLQPQRVASDGIFYFAPLRSAVVDRDLDFENEYRVLGAQPGFFQRTSTGMLPNQHSIGPALLWLPGYLVAHLLALSGLYRPTGFGYPYFTVVATTTALAGFAGVLFVFRLVRSYFEPGLAFLATLFVWLATFHVWYMVFEPSMSHALAMASVSGFLLVTHRGLSGERAFFLAGALGGLVALVRWQNVLFLPVGVATTLAARGRPRRREILAGILGFALAFLPQLLYWKILYGRFLLVPQGGSFIDWTSFRFEEVLLSSRHGLLSWSPVLWLSIAGIPSFVSRAKAFGWGLVLAALAALFVNASVYDWWAGASFGSRRFDGVLPLFALGLAGAVGWLVRSVERRPLATVGALLLPFVLWNFLLMGVYFAGAIPPDGPASFQRAASDGMDLVYRRTGYPFSWPGSLADLLVHDRPPASYDLLGSGSLANNVDVRMGDTDALFLGRGWSLPHRGRERTFREVQDPAGAEIYVALVEPAPYLLALEAHPRQAASVHMNDRWLGVAEAADDGLATLDVPREAVRSGVNRILLSKHAEEPLGLFRMRLARKGE